MNILKQKEAMAKIESRSGSMSSETKNFIQKICYRKSASIDMTQYGFIRDCKVRPLNLMIKPLQEQLDRIWGENSQIMTSGRQSPSKRSEKGRPNSKVRKVASRTVKSAKHAAKTNNNQKNHIFELIKSNVKERKRV